MISIFSILRPTGNNMSKRPAPASNKAPNAISKRRKITSTSTATYNTVPRTRGVYAAGEHKYFDTSGSAILARTEAWTGTTVDPSTLNTLVVPVQGAAIWQRIGREIAVHKLRINGYFQMGGVNNLSADFIAAQLARVIVVQDMQTNADQMKGEQLFSNTVNGVVSPNAPLMAFQNLDNFGRFKVLKDKVYSLANPNFANDGTDPTKKDYCALVKHFKFNINFAKPIRIRFNAINGGTVADIVDNSFHILANCRNFGAVDATQPPVSISYRCRAVYSDA